MSLRWPYLVLFLVVLTACPGTGPTAPTKYFVLSGISNITNDEAVQEAQNAIDEAVRNGCTPISIGGGTGVGVDLLEAAAYNVHVLVECPRDGPDLLPTGIAVP